MLSADGVPILMHDETIDRTTDGRGRVADLGLAQLRAFNVGGEPVPTLAEALARCRRLGLWTNIEIKPAAGHDEATGEAVGRMLAGGWNGHGIVSSFSPLALAAAQNCAPSARYALLAEDLPADWRQISQTLRLAAWHLAAAAPASALAAVRVMGLGLACYTVDDPAEARRLFAAGVLAVFSDRPDSWSPTEM